MTAHGIELDSPAIQDFCRRWKIRELSVFGSILRDDFRPDSDVDFLADFEENSEWDICDLLDMKDELAGIVGRSVDLVSRLAIEECRNRFYQQEIFSTAEPVVAAR